MIGPVTNKSDRNGQLFIIYINFSFHEKKEIHKNDKKQPSLLLFHGN